MTLSFMNEEHYEHYVLVLAYEQELVYDIVVHLTRLSISNW